MVAPRVVANPGRTIILPDDIGAISATRLFFPNKPQMATLDFSVDISAILAADQAACVGVEVLALGPDVQSLPLVVTQQAVPGSVLSPLIGGGDLYVAYAVRYNFATGGAGKAQKTYSIDVWLTVANVASYSGDYGYMSNTGYPTGVGPKGEPGAGAVTVAPNSGLVLVGNTLYLNASNLPTSPDGLETGAPWNNNGVLSFAPDSSMLDFVP